jgi:hypothetical protein
VVTIAFVYALTDPTCKRDPQGSYRICRTYEQWGLAPCDTDGGSGL